MCEPEGISLWIKEILFFPLTSPVLPWHRILFSLQWMFFFFFFPFCRTGGGTAFQFSLEVYFTFILCWWLAILLNSFFFLNFLFLFMHFCLQFCSSSYICKRRLYLAFFPQRLFLFSVEVFYILSTFYLASLLYLACFFCQHYRSR